MVEFLSEGSECIQCVHKIYTEQSTEIGDQQTIISVAGQQTHKTNVCNRVSETATATNTSDSFKHKLKTNLFNIAFN